MMDNLNLRNFNSFEEAKRFFREQIKRLHPDKGGNKEEFLDLLERYHEFLKSYQKSLEIKVVKNPPLRGNYFFSILELTVEEVALGGKKKIQIPGEEVICPKCKGTGKKEDGNTQICGFCKGQGFIEVKDNKKNTVSYLTCPYCKGFGYLLTEYCDECKGKGKIRIQKEVFIEIPLGLKEGDILYISKFAINSSCDLYLEINILPHPYFILKENKLIYKCKIPFWEIILKEEIPIYTLEGEEKISTSLFTQGSPIVIKGRGPFLSNGERGDLIVDFTIYIPENIPSEAKELISKAAEIIQKKNGF